MNANAFIGVLLEREKRWPSENKISTQQSPGSPQGKLRPQGIPGWQFGVARYLFSATRSLEGALLERGGQRRHIGKSSWHDSIILNFQCSGGSGGGGGGREGAAPLHTNTQPAAPQTGVLIGICAASSRARVCVSDNKPNFILPRGGRLQ